MQHAALLAFVVTTTVASSIRNESTPPARGIMFASIPVVRPGIIFASHVEEHDFAPPFCHDVYGTGNCSSCGSSECCNLYYVEETAGTTFDCVWSTVGGSSSCSQSSVSCAPACNSVGGHNCSVCNKDRPCCNRHYVSGEGVGGYFNCVISKEGTCIKSAASCTFRTEVS